MSRDRSIPRGESRLLGSPNRLRLGVFGANCSGGCTMTGAEEAIQVEWEESKRLAQAADQAGIEAFIPIARWRGFGGETDFQARSFETITWAAGLGAVTRTIQVFGTVHVPTVHPVRLAKEVATVDHISGGHFGLNLVAGWNAPELSMFGLTQREHDERYEVAQEFTEVLKRLWTEDGDFDFEGDYYTLDKAFSYPKPVQDPFPVVMCAGVSPAGRRFAAQHADIMFVITDNLETVTGLVKEIKGNAAERFGREILVFAQTHIVCADTEDEAKRHHAYAIQEKGDYEGAENLLNMLMKNSATGEYDCKVMQERIMAGWGATPLIGTPEQVVEGLEEVAATGLDGVTMSWVDYDEGLDQFRESILPLMIEAGLRQEEPEIVSDTVERTTGFTR